MSQYNGLKRHINCGEIKNKNNKFAIQVHLHLMKPCVGPGFVSRNCCHKAKNTRWSGNVKACVQFFGDENPFEEALAVFLDSR